LLRVANLTTSGTTLSSYSYAVDAVGNRQRVVEVTGNRVSWSYDNTYQLRNEQRSGSNSYNITYTYDPVGNRLSLVNGGVPTTSTYDAANQLVTAKTTSGTTTYTFDAAGNQLITRAPSNQITTNTWDFENRLTQSALPAAIVDTFTYNGDGQRVQKIDSTGTTKHVWDGQNIILETDGSNIIQVVYTLQPELYGNLVSQRRSGTTSLYLFDGLGSTIQLTSSTGSVTDSYLYDSWGNILLTTGSTVNWLRYVGRIGCYYDADGGIYLLRARHLLPGSGRFMSTESLGLAIGRISAGATAYEYVRNNPVAFTDPSGNSATLAVGGALGFTVSECLNNAIKACVLPLGVAHIAAFACCLGCFALPPPFSLPCFLACTEAAELPIAIGAATCVAGCFVSCYYQHKPCAVVIPGGGIATLPMTIDIG
jgi:RHS repeat-associated protein